MAQVPDFIKFHCGSNNEPHCVSCPRDFMIPIRSVEGVYKDNNGRAIIGINNHHFVPHPKCLMRLFYIETGHTWEQVVSMLDGSVQDFGNVLLVNRQEIID